MRNSPTNSSALDALWQAPAILWMVLAGEGLAVVLALAPGGGEERWRSFGVLSLTTQWVLLFTLVLLYALRHVLSRMRPLGVAYVALLILMVNTWLIASVAWFVLQENPSISPDGLQPLLLRLTGIVLAVGMLGVAAFENHRRGRSHAVRAKQAELESLQARIRPHFLFNTLNTGAALVRRRPEEVERLLLDLSDLFRAALAGPRQISLEDELALARRYLEIESLRFGERLTVHWELPQVIPEVSVPALSIQPLVENAIRHGVERLPRGGDVEIAVSNMSGVVVVRISNPVPRTDALAHHGHHVGLSASQVRIEAMTDGRGSVQTHIADGRYIATVRLPTV